MKATGRKMAITIYEESSGAIGKWKDLGETMIYVTVDNFVL
jgi:hypothetical protein